MPALPCRLNRTVLIRPPRDIVFRFFRDNRRWAAWWGEGSTIDARPGGSVLIRYPGGIEASRTVVEIQPPDRIVFTYGYVKGQPIRNFPPEHIVHAQRLQVEVWVLKRKHPG